MRVNPRRLAAILGGSAIALAISATPIASAATHLIPPDPQQGCSASGLGTVCQTPGNAQINDGVPPVQFYPYGFDGYLFNPGGPAFAGGFHGHGGGFGGGHGGFGGGHR